MMSVSMMFWINGFCMLLMGCPMAAIGLFVASAGLWIADRVQEVRQERKAIEVETARWKQMRADAAEQRRLMIGK